MPQSAERFRSWSKSKGRTVWFVLFSLSKKQYFDSCASCGSTHKIEFAEQIHKFRGRGPDHPLLPLCGNSPCVPRNLYKGRKNVPARRVFFFGIRSKAWFRSRGCRKTLVFRQPPKDEPLVRPFFLTLPDKVGILNIRVKEENPCRYWKTNAFAWKLTNSVPN